MNRKTIALLAAVLCAWASVTGAADGFTALNRAEAAQLVNPARHERPTIVTLWSLDCVHCKKNLAVFAKLTQSDAGLRLITVAVEQADAAHAAPLERLGVAGERYAYGGEAPEALAFALDPKWRGELPRTLFFDGRGGRVAVSGVVDEAETRRLLGLAAR